MANKLISYDIIIVAITVCTMRLQMLLLHFKRIKHLKPPRMFHVLFVMYMCIALLILSVLLKYS